MVDGGAFLPNITPAGWVTIRGLNLSTTTRIWTGADFNGNVMPTSLDGVSVAINGKAAAVYYISPTQLNVLAPLDATDAPVQQREAVGPVTVSVTNRQGTTSRTANSQLVAPSFFMLDPDNRRYVAAVNLDGTLVGRGGLYPDNPAATKPLVGRGRALVYGTGWGLTNPVQPDGLVFTDARRLPAAANARITIGGVQVVVEFAGAVSPGLYQFNIVAPDLPAGDYAIVGEINGVRTQPNAFITLAASP